MWRKIIKIGPLRDTTNFLNSVFSIPYEIIETLDVSRTLISLIAQGSLDRITEEEFNNLMELSNTKQYQELINQLTKLLQSHGEEKVREIKEQRHKDKYPIYHSMIAEQAKRAKK